MSAPEREIWIVGLGAHTTVGLSAPATAAAVRAGVARMCEHPEAVLPDGEPVPVAMITGVDADPGAMRLAALLEPALNEALEPLAAAPGPVPPMPLLLGLPEPVEGQDLAAEVAALLDDRPLEHGTLSEVSSSATGHAAALAALKDALALLGEEQELCLVAGVDSMLTPEALAREAGEGRILSGENPHGFVPGEGAGCLLLATADAAKRLELPCLGRVLGAATATEEHTIYGDTVSTGAGLTAAFREALAALPEGEVQLLTGDMNGQPYRGEEYVYALIRNRERFADALEVSAPADRWGDVGAAAPLLGMILAVEAARRGYGAGPRTLVWASSVGGLRGAAVLDTTGLTAPPGPTFKPGS